MSEPKTIRFIDVHPGLIAEGSAMRRDGGRAAGDPRVTSNFPLLRPRASIVLYDDQKTRFKKMNPNSPEWIDLELRKMERADRVLREIGRPCDSLVESQESLSKLIDAMVTRPPALSRDISPQNVTHRDPMEWLNNMRIPIPSTERLLSKLTRPESRTLAQLEQMSDDEIRSFLNGNVSIITVQLARHVREMRQLERVNQPHWSTNWQFWFGVAGVILALIALLVG